MARSTVHYADKETNRILKKLHNKLRPAGTPVQRVEYIIELLLLRIFEAKLKQDDEFKPLRKLFTQDYKWKNPKTGQEEHNENKLFSYLLTVSNTQILEELNNNFFPFYSAILHNARNVFKTNLPQKVQDQLVLIEEVFSNSNFTNNVNSGNLQEVISLVSEIEEVLLLKTDLLGDAIESALSETGGTKDIGLFRTPGHIRQFMVALLEPNFDDIIFDPACGTGGFLFDSFEFVMRRIDSSREWPGQKAHPELREWFDNYFIHNTLPFPSIAQTTQFYRSGVSGIEYLGMIRKMAAINFYIRGLNPANIQQGDSLAKYNVVRDAGSKSIVLANPPFGAERDQEAYPDVWSEYAKESETTILFVKLMFELLKSGGHCAVVVSEGFHTWDQFSAKSLRKMLLDEAQLKAVISLPQGLFVSKSGQGPKTSILLFKKGEKTDWVWFYKVTNDGYTMGTNRKEQKGNQLVECLNLFHQYVKQDKQPPESKNHFCIPSEWIKTLDPRIKDKIRIETRSYMEVKGKKEREKKEKELIEKINEKKLSSAEKELELKIFDQMFENRIQNEIAKRIDKAHNYSFNLSYYKSTLSKGQILEWNESLKHIKPNGSATIDEVYKKLNSSKPESALPYLIKLNPVNALEADIAREYVNNMAESILAQQNELIVIKEILRSTTKYEKEKLGNLISLKRNILKLEVFNPDYRIVEKIRFIDGAMILRNDSETGIDLQFVELNDLLISKINFHQGATAINNYGKVLASLDYLVYEVDRTKASPEFIHLMVRDKHFLQFVSETKPGGIKGRSKPEFIETLEIPFPSPDEQNIIASQIEKQKEIIDGIEKVVKNIGNSIDLSNYPLKPIGLYAKVLGGFSFPSDEISDIQSANYIPLIKIGSVLNGKITNDLGFVKKSYKEEKQLFCLSKGDIVFAMTRPIIKSGLKYAVIEDAFNESMLNQRVGKWQFINNELLPNYLAYFMETSSYLKQLEKFCIDEANQPNVSNGEFESIQIPVPDIEIQEKIVTQVSEQKIIIEKLLLMKSESEKQIGKILADVWGVEFVESIIE